MDFDAISWVFMPNGGILRLFYLSFAGMFLGCSSFESLWISLCADRIGESIAKSLATQRSKRSQFGEQSIEIVFGGTIEQVDVQEIGVRHHGCLTFPDPAARDEAGFADPARTGEHAR